MGECMNQETWDVVDQYINDTLVPTDEALEMALADTAAAGMPEINVTPNQGKLLAILARSIGAKNILEIGTLGGYSTIWLARALQPGGKVITLEFNPKHVEVARGNIARAGLADVVDIRQGAALDSLAVIATEGHDPFDMVFVDADKNNNPGYFEWAMKLTRPGSLIIVDNVIRKGAVADANSDDHYVHGVRRMHEMIAAEPRVMATALQTVGAKGYDGFTMLLVTG